MRKRGNITRYKDGPRRYYRDHRKAQPSVTTVLDAFYAPAWAHAANVAKEAVALGELIATGETRTRMSYAWVENHWEPAYSEYNPLELLRDYEYMKGSAMRRAGEAQDRGTLCDLYVKEWMDAKFSPYDKAAWLDGKLAEGRPLLDDEPDSTPVGWRCDYEEVMPHLVSASKFLLENDVEIKAVDLRFISHQLGCGGEADALGTCNGSPYLFEFKTSSSVSRSHAVQTCVYHKGLKLPDEIGRMVVTFGKDAYRAVVITDWQECLSEWRRLRKCWEFAHRDTPWETAVRGTVDVFDQEAR